MSFYRIERTRVAKETIFVEANTAEDAILRVWDGDQIYRHNQPPLARFNDENLTSKAIKITEDEMSGARQRWTQNNMPCEMTRVRPYADVDMNCTKLEKGC